MSNQRSLIHDRANAVSDVLFFSIGEGAIVIDERGNIARANQAALDILGYKKSDLIGKWYPETVIAETEEGNRIPNIDRPITEVFLSGKPVFKRIYYRKKDGTRVPVALTVSPVMLDDRPLGAIELFRDITEDIQLEHAKDEFISIASHQLRTPATIVKQYLGMILDGYVTAPNQQQKMLKLAYEHNDNQLDIINNLLQVAQAEANKLTVAREDTNIVELLKKVVETQTPDFQKKNIGLHLVSNTNSLYCYIDPLHIKMVFENLITNAYKYSFENTTVKVIISSTVKSVIVKVKDEGMGIDSSDIPKLFKKFSRSDNVNSTVNGTGLGLYWAKKLVDLHEGKITLVSKLGKGTTFSVYLPRDASPT